MLRAENGPHLDPEPHLLGIDAAELVLVGGGTLAVRLIEQVLKDHLGFFEPCGVDVGNIVARDVQQGLVRFNAGDSGHEGSQHGGPPPLGLFVARATCALRCASLLRHSLAEVCVRAVFSVLQSVQPFFFSAARSGN